MSRKSPPISIEKAWDVDVSGLTCRDLTEEDNKILAENDFVQPEEKIKEDVSYISKDHKTAFSLNCGVSLFDPVTYTNNRAEMKETIMKPSFVKSHMKSGDTVYIGDGFAFNKDFGKLIDTVSSLDDFNPDKISVFHGGRGASQSPARITFIDSKDKKYIVAVTVPFEMDKVIGYEMVSSSPACEPSTVGGFLNTFRKETKYQRDQNDVDFAPIPVNIFTSKEFNKDTIKEMSPLEISKVFREIAVDPFFEGDDEFFDSTMEIDALAEHPRFKELIGYVNTCGVAPKSKTCNADLCLIKTGRESGIQNKGVVISLESLDHGETTETCSPWKDASRENYKKKEINADVRTLSKLSSLSQKQIKDGLTICHVKNDDGTGFNKFVTKQFIAYKGAFSLLDDFISSIPTKPNTLTDVVEFAYD